MAAKKPLRRLRVKYIVDGCDFRKRPRTLFTEWAQEHKAEAASLKRTEWVLFVSSSGKYLAWVRAPFIVHTTTGLERESWDPHWWVIDGATGWNPLMLQEYGKAAGIDMGLPDFRELYAARQARRRGVVEDD